MKKQNLIISQNSQNKAIEEFKRVFDLIDQETRSKWIKIHENGKFEVSAALSTCQDFANLRIRNFGQIQKGGFPSLATVRKYQSEDAVLNFLENALSKLIQNYNVKRNMNQAQIEVCAELILEKYFFFSPVDFILFFKKVISGELIQVFETLDSSVIFEALKAYDRKRREFIREQEEKRLKEKRQEEFKKGRLMTKEEALRFAELKERIGREAALQKRKPSNHIEELRKRYGTK